MVALNEKFSQYLNQLGKGAFNVEVQTRYSGGGLDNQQAGSSGITLRITNPALEKDNLLPRAILARLSSIKPLADNVQFESDRKHAENMAKQLRAFIAEGADIPADFAQWFDRQAEKDAKPRPEHALKIEKTDLGIRVKIDVPKGIDATHIARKLEENKSSFIDGLAKRTAKYWDANAKEGIEAKIKGLDYAITSVKNEYNNFVEIEIRSKGPNSQLEKVKDAPDKWNVILTGDEPKNLRLSNPLSTLPDGDGKTKESPALLQKALARAILFDDKKTRDFFPQIAGSKDMQIAITKSLLKVAETKPALAEKVKKFLEDPMFKEHDRWHGRHVAHLVGDTSDNAKGDDIAPPKIEKVSDGNVLGSQHNKYVPGQIEIDLPLPAIKFNEIMTALEAWSPEAAQTQQPAPTAPAVAPPAVSPLANMVDQAVKAAEPATEKPPVAVGNTVVHPKQPAHISPKQAKDFVEKVQKGEINLGLGA